MAMSSPTSETPVSAQTTPVGPLFSSLRIDSLSYDQQPVRRCKCVPVVESPTTTTDQNLHGYCFPGSRVPDISLAQKVGAEFVGTFIIIFGAAAASIANQKYSGIDKLMVNATCSGLAVLIAVLSTGHISGAHLNPAVTIAFTALRHFPWTHVPAYIAAQVSASLCASFALKGLFHPFMSGGVTVPSVGHGQAFAFEFIITFNLMFVITAVATDTKAVGEMAGIAIGASVMFNILVAGPSTGAAMNPVRALGPAFAAGNFRGLWIYLMAPTLGALAGASIYTMVKLRGDPEPPRESRSFGSQEFRALPMHCE